MFEVHTQNEMVRFLVLRMLSEDVSMAPRFLWCAGV